MAERWAVEDRVGLTAAAVAEEAAFEVYNAADLAAERDQPRTLACLVAKGAWVAERSSGVDDLGALGELFARQVAAFGEAMA